MGKLNQENLVEDGLTEMKKYHEEYQDKGKGSETVRNFLENAFKDEALLKRYLIGRKYRPKHAWESLRRYGEVRFEKYPEMFPATIPSKSILFRDNQPIFGILKGRDKKGCRIAFFESAWDTEKCNLDDLFIHFVQAAEKAVFDENVLNDGFIFVHDFSKLGFEHAKHYTLGSMLRLMNLFWFAFPIKLKGVYFANLPSILTCLYAMMKPFMPKKFKDRLFVTTSSRGFQDLHERVSLDVLPKFLGGNLETDEATDFDFIDY